MKSTSQTVRSGEHATRATASDTTSEEAPLSPYRAFVVQFRLGAGGEPPGPFTGRVEHVTSGHAARFHSVEELVAVIARVLADVRE